MPFERKGEVIQLHGDREDGTDGLAPQERTVTNTARIAFSGAVRGAMIDPGLIPGFDPDLYEGNYRAVKLSELMPGPKRHLEVVPNRHLQSVPTEQPQDPK